MNEIEFKNSTEVIFCEDVSQKIKDYANRLGAKRLLFVTGKNSSFRIAEELIKQTDDAVNVNMFVGVETNPREEIILKAFAMAESFKPDLILTVGGGSVHDCGKAVSVLLSNNNSKILEDYTVTGKLSVPGIEKAIPVITIPTIVGSGAEVSPAALVRIGNEKKVIFSPLLHPVATLINVSYMRNIPISILARTAFDSLIQSLEGYISENANTLSDAFALASVRYYCESLSFMKSESLSDETFRKLAIASVFSSYVCSVSGVGAIHAFSDPLSGRFNIHHADALAMVCIETLKFNFKTTKADLVRLANAINVEERDITDVTDFILSTIQSIIDSWKLGNDKPHVDLDIITDMVAESNNPDMAGNPYTFSTEEMQEVFRKSLLV